MEIDVGECVRTDNGIIGKYVKYRGIEDSIENNHRWIGFDIEKDIVKHSKNIIDLIEKGDYVNGEKVVSILNGFVEGTMEIELANHKKIYRKNVNEIKTIVTKEQFEQNAYRLEE